MGFIFTNIHITVKHHPVLSGSKKRWFPGINTMVFIGRFSMGFQSIEEQHESSTPDRTTPPALALICHGAGEQSPRKLGLLETQIWMVGGFKHFLFMSLSQMTNSIIFKRGRLNHQPDEVLNIVFSGRSSKSSEKFGFPEVKFRGVPSGKLTYWKSYLFQDFQVNHQ